MIGDAFDRWEGFVEGDPDGVGLNCCGDTGGTLDSGYGQKFHTANDAHPQAIAAQVPCFVNSMTYSGPES